MKKIASIKSYAKKYHKQAGMTLIELTVVLLILIGLAGLLIPYVGSFTQTTHDSTNASNLAQMNNAVNRYIVEQNKLPPHTDNLINHVGDDGSATGPCSGASAGAVYCGLSNPALFTATTFGSGSIQAQSIAKASMSMMVGNNPNVENKTFGTSTGMIMQLNNPDHANWDSNVFALVNDANGHFSGGGSGMTAYTGVAEHLATALGRDPMVYKTTCYDFVAVGLGDNNELVQHTSTAAPVFFPQDSSYGPVQRYAHLIAILQVDKDNTTSGCSEFTEKARFLGVVANVPSDESPHLVGVNALVEQGWQNRAEAGN